jgi:uncharacterized RDD family membrane protein YckC
VVEPDAGPPASPREQDVIGPRSAAALIDIVVLGALFVIVAAIVGSFSVGSGSFTISLAGPWFLLYLALLLLYYFALEAATGQTVGKLLFGLRVLRADGSRPSTGAIAGRTLLRIIDWLPVFYLIGFIAMLGTGMRRQRLGDIAADTVVTRALPSRNRALGVIPLAVVLVAAIGLAASRGHSAAGPQTYRGHGVSFVYPGNWQLQDRLQSSNRGAQQLWSTSVGPGTPLDAVTVTGYLLNRRVGAGDLGGVVPELQSLVRGMFGQMKGSLQRGPAKTTVGGLPAVLFDGAGTINGNRIVSTLVFVFDGNTEYYINCQRTNAHYADVAHGCVQVVSTFRVRP